MSIRYCAEGLALQCLVLIVLDIRLEKVDLQIFTDVTFCSVCGHLTCSVTCGEYKEKIHAIHELLTDEKSVRLVRKWCNNFLMYMWGI